MVINTKYTSNLMSVSFHVAALQFRLYLSFSSAITAAEERENVVAGGTEKYYISSKTV
jgi:hypothetical protein